VPLPCSCSNYIAVCLQGLASLLELTHSLQSAIGFKTINTERHLSPG
jgi:hypothetical protein